MRIFFVLTILLCLVPVAHANEESENAVLTTVLSRSTLVVTGEETAKIKD